jgi:hypothetical protein
MDNAIKRGAYAGIFLLILALPLVVLNHFNVYGQLNGVGKFCLLLTIVLVGVCGIFFDYAFIQLAKKHNEQFLQTTTWIVLGIVVFTLPINIIHVLNTQSQQIIYARYLLSSGHMIVVAFQAFAFARLNPYYGEIAFQIRNALICSAITAFLAIITILLAQDATFLAPLGLLLGVIALCVIPIAVMRGIKLLFIASRSSRT